MAIDPARERELLRDEVDAIAAMDPAEFVLKGYHGKPREDIDYILRAYKRFAECDLRLIYEGELPSLRERASNIRAVLDHYRSDPVPDDREQERRAGELVAERKNLNTAVIPRLSFYGTSQREAEASLAAIRQRAEEVFGEVEGILSATNAAAGKVSVARYVQIFGDQARADRNAADLWFRGTLVAGTVTFLVTYKLFEHFRDRETVGGTYDIPLGVLVLAVVSILSFLFVWCARTYRAYLHNAAMNLHRHNALMTFEAFAIQAEHDPAAKMALLHMAANAIFTPQNTGFVGGRESMPMPQPQILEILRPSK